MGYLPLDQKWLKAAVIGSVWAAFEIIAGSFLHNLRIPFAGMFLASASVFLLIAFLHLWNEKGIILRAGIICALMKSISPSAIIFGPMVGIFMEALIIEGTTRILGRNIFGFLIAGGLAVFWTLVQKILNLLILYGFDLLRIADALYQYLIKLTGINAITFEALFGIAGLFYFLFGMTSAGLGILTGRRYLKNKKLDFDSIELEKVSEPFGKDHTQKYAFRNLLLIILVIVLSLFLINKKLHLAALLTGIGFIAFCMKNYKGAMRRLRKPGLWIQFGIITLAAAFIWEWISTGNYFSVSGLLVGLEMNFRAIIIIFGFSAISVELRNPFIKAILYRNGFSKLYASLNLSFSALPSIISQLPRPKALIQNRQGIVFQLLAQSEMLLEKFISQNSQPKIFIITGEIHQGKTTFAEQLILKLSEAGFKCGGFLSLGTMANGTRNSYTLQKVGANENVPLASASQIEGWNKFRRFWFNPEAFRKGNAWIDQALGQNCGCIFIDEIGPMELEGEGWSQSIELLAGKKEILQFWIIRKTLVEEAVKKWNLIDFKVLQLDTVSTNDLLEIICYQKKMM
ncbi:MAG: nucleoside-triphosphatase [Bacteroidales bacterium]|nr:nucleoside-triphosphatase [Bacteroidales bacterium]MDP2236917.1 nucleoside-triphosphatase [Bacteroidales bacterium]